MFWPAAAVLCFLYGLLILSIASGTRFFAVWFVLSAVCILLAIASRLHLWGKAPTFLKGLILVLVIAGAAFFLIIESVILSGFGRKGEPDLDYLIVPGAQVRETGPSRVLQFRLDEACAYLNRNGRTICIVSGGRGYNEPFPEAEGMKTYLVSRGVSAERILTESASRSTAENMRNSMALFDPEKDSVGIVTNNFHLFRACGIARKCGIRHVSGISAGSSPLFLPNNMLREFFGVVKDFVLPYLVHGRRKI